MLHFAQIFTTSPARDTSIWSLKLQIFLSKNKISPDQNPTKYQPRTGHNSLKIKPGIQHKISEISSTNTTIRPEQEQYNPKTRTRTRQKHTTQPQTLNNKTCTNQNSARKGNGREETTSPTRTTAHKYQGGLNSSGEITNQDLYPRVCEIFGYGRINERRESEVQSMVKNKQARSESEGENF